MEANNDNNGNIGVASSPLKSSPMRRRALDPSWSSWRRKGEAGLSPLVRSPSGKLTLGNLLSGKKMSNTSSSPVISQPSAAHNDEAAAAATTTSAIVQSVEDFDVSPIKASSLRDASSTSSCPAAMHESTIVGDGATTSLTSIPSSVCCQNCGSTQLTKVSEMRR